MKSWFKKLLSLLAGRDWTRAPRRTDWRGRPAGETTGGATPSVSLPEGDPYATLRLPSSAGPPGAAPGVPPSGVCPASRGE
jgi:hypothetical protein